jgi:hypothetical protein
MFRSALLALLGLALVPVTASAEVSISCAPACTVAPGTEVTFGATPDGTVVAYGDYVERGDVIIVVGNTSNSSGAHLHYHVTSTGDTEDDSYGGSMPIQFERLGAGGLFCDDPKKGNWYVSTNG